MFNIHITIERWKYNKECNVYVSTLGRVRDKNKNEIEQYPDGHMLIKLENGKLRSVHRIMMETFKPIEGMRELTVDHINGNNKDNRFANLRWMTREENQRLGIEKTEVVIKAKQATKVDDVVAPDRGMICFRKKDDTTWLTASLNRTVDIVAGYSKSSPKQIKKDLQDFMIKKLDGKKKYGFIFKF